MSSRPVLATITSVPSSATNVTVLAANAARKGAIITNISTAILYVRFGSAAATTTDFTAQLPATTGYYEVPFGYTGQITGIWASANGTANVTELS
jgi:hypothetical protein